MTLTLRQKLVLLLTTLLALQLAGGAISMWSINSYRENTRAVVGDTLVEIEALGQIDAHIHELLYETAAVLAFGEAAHGEHRAEVQATLRATLAELSESATTELSDADHEHQTVAALKAQVESLIATSDQLIGDGLPANTARFASGMRRLEEEHEAFQAVFDEAHAAVSAERDAAVAATEYNPILAPLLIGLLAFTCSVALLALIAERVLRPLERLRAATDAVAAGNLERRAEIGGADEIGALGRSFDAMVTTIAAQQYTLQERAGALEQANAAQLRLLETVQSLTVPAIPVGAGVLALPLLGTLDHERIEAVTCALLRRVADEHAHTVIIDVTGISALEQDMASRLLQMAQSVQLLGAGLILTGVSPQMALQVVDSQADLSRLRVRATLGEGLALALHSESLHNN